MIKATTKKILLKMYVSLFIAVNRAGCHQRADKSFFYKGYQFPMCARCTGVMVGYLIAIPIYFIYTLNISIYIVLCAVMFLDWYIQYLKIRTSTNIRRFISGTLGGFGLMSLELVVCEFIISFLKVHL